jgi:hypothetical protein
MDESSRNWKDDHPMTDKFTKSGNASALFKSGRSDKNNESI